MNKSNATVVALGSFDGLHKGHSKVIACALKEKERGLIPVVLLFDSHPLSILTGNAPNEILQNEIREEMLGNIGITPKYISFKEIYQFSPEEFFHKILIEKLNAKVLCCGANYHFGKNGAGTVEVLKELCDKNNVSLSVAPLEEFEGYPISSTRIRNEITHGNIEKANAMLGFPFTFKALVKSGYRRGRLLGSPTINQYFDKNFIKPKAGVYAGVTLVEGVEYPSVSNIGFRPSFENEDFRSETCILGFDGDLYGETIQVKLIKYLREELKFDCVEDLKEQIQKDALASEKIFRKEAENV